jgi:hypothetical protein
MHQACFFASLQGGGGLLRLTSNKRKLVLVLFSALLLVMLSSGTAFASVGTVTTTAATSVSYTTATAGGTYSGFSGGQTPNREGVVYSSSNSTPTVNGTGCTSSDQIAGGGTISRSLSGLSSNTLYYFRAYVRYSGGSYAYGDVLTFTTLSGVTFSPNGNPTPAKSQSATVTVNSGSNPRYAWSQNSTSAPGSGSFASIPAGGVVTQSTGNGNWYL